MPNPTPSPALAVDAITGSVVAYLWQVRKGYCVALSVTGDPPELVAPQGLPHPSPTGEP